MLKHWIITLDLSSNQVRFQEKKYALCVIISRLVAHPRIYFQTVYEGEF